MTRTHPRISASVALALATADGADKYTRRVELKRAYDPTNLFRHNHNIRPDMGNQSGPGQKETVT
jgi:hypothetical protein